ncbi:MAG: adenylate/guanylate cyclase domain-containing protein [Bacteroidota bacterium]
MLFALLLIGAGHHLMGQASINDIEFKVYSFEEGLSHRNVFKVAQDHWGFIWVATINGLNRFDGRDFSHYTTSLDEPFPLGNEFIPDMAIGKDSLIWLSISNYLVSLDPRNHESHKIRVAKSSGVYDQKRSFSNLVVDRRGNLWASAYVNESGKSYLQKINEEARVEDVLPGEGNFAKRPVLELDGQYYYSFSQNKIRVIDQQGNHLKDLDLPFYYSSDAAGWITQLQIDLNGQIWALLDNGLLYFLPQGANLFELHPISRQTYGNDTYHALLVDEKNNVFMGGMGKFLCYDAAQETVRDYNANIQNLLKHTCNYRQIFRDATGVIWLATDFGLIKMMQSDERFNTYLSEGSEFCNDGTCSIRGITSDALGNVYFSYYNSIHVLEASTGLLRPLFPTGNFFNPPFGLQYHEGALWTGNGKRIDLGTLEVSSILDAPATDLGATMVDSNNRIWFGFHNKIHFYNPFAQSLEYYEDPQGLIDTAGLEIAHLYHGRNGQHFWVATLDRGIYKIDKVKGGVAHYRSDSTSKVQLLHNKVNQTYEDRLGFLWAATGKGLHRLNIETEALTVYGKEQGLANDFINSFLSEGDSVFWVTTDNGLSRFSVKDERFINFFKKDGIAANEFNRISYHQAQDGRMYFGGIHGVTAFYPGNHFLQARAQKEGKVFFTGFSKLDGTYDSLISFNNGLSEDAVIEISHRDKMFTFEFALANYQSPSDNLYSYRLDPYDTDWSKESKSSQARYGMVPAGNYVFRVRAKSGKGKWNEQELAVKVQVAQAYYKSWWFIGLMTILGVALIYGLFLLRLYRLQQGRRQLEKEVAIRTQELILEKKKSDDLLLNILPAETAEELKVHGKAQAKRYEAVTVFFSDFKDFTIISEQLEPEQLVAEIDHCFRMFDEMMDKYGLEKIKTVGDAYLCAGGIPSDNQANAVQVVKAALDIQVALKAIAADRKIQHLPFFETRIGIHTGPVVAGIVGIKKFAFDIWGDTVNIAARLEDNSEEGKVNISQDTYELVKDHFSCTYRGKITAKNKGEIDMYYVDGPKN